MNHFVKKDNFRSATAGAGSSVHADEQGQSNVYTRRLYPVLTCAMQEILVKTSSDAIIENTFFTHES